MVYAIHHHETKNSEGKRRCEVCVKECFAKTNMKLFFYEFYFALRELDRLLLNGIVILTLLTAPVDWVELEESESSALAGGGADGGASSGLDGEWLN